MGGTFIKIAAVYLAIGITLGIYMGITEEFEYTPLHAHLNLLGWATTGIFGLIYIAFPSVNGKLGKTHFWLHNIGAPLVLIGMILFINGQEGIAFPIALSGSLMVLGGTFVFMVNMFKNIKNGESGVRNKQKLER
ncbi:cbb3-type cytochrome c oxidase subunit I [Planococcus sp. SSTMD024]|uniref:cbb3-type cytochrome c oxidase subunit I n=1 Tax=Planococcus sp. SSTMD024 TaxID=3242163 RepID=UPI00351EA074